MYANPTRLWARIGDRPVYVLAYSLLLLLLFGVVFYDKIDELERVRIELNVARDELRTLEASMVDIIHEEAERREEEVRQRLEEANRKREQTIARSYALLQRAEAELVNSFCSRRRCPFCLFCFVLFYLFYLFHFFCCFF